MSHYSIRTTKRPRGFEVISADGRTLAQVHQPSLFSQNLEGTCEGIGIQIVREGFWHMRYRIDMNGSSVGTMRMGMWGGMKIALISADRTPVELEFANAGPWWSRYHLRSGKSLPLLEVKQVFRWSSFTTDFAVEVKSAGIASEQMALMLVLCGFCARVKRAQAHAAAG